MNSRVSLLLASLLGCSMLASAAPPAATPAASPSTPAAQPDATGQLPLQRKITILQSKPIVPPLARDSNLPPPRTCHLGNDCLSMDSRPFEVCQLSTIKNCGDKLAEVMQVETPKSATKPVPPVQKTSR